MFVLLRARAYALSCLSVDQRRNNFEVLGVVDTWAILNGAVDTGLGLAPQPHEFCSYSEAQPV